jgi:hypothetical protein
MIPINEAGLARPSTFPSEALVVRRKRSRDQHLSAQQVT